MDTIFMKTGNSKTSEPHALLLKLTDKLDLRRGEKGIALSNLSIYYIWENIKNSYNNNKFKISAPTWNGKFEFPNNKIADKITSVLKISSTDLNSERFKK